MYLTINKIDAVSKKSIPLPNAKFQIDYYKTEVADDRDLSSSTAVSSYLKNATPERTWYIKSDNNGEASFTELYFTSYNGKNSDERYKDSKGRAYIPYGTIVIKEVQSPDESKYALNPNYFVRKVDDGGIADNTINMDLTIEEPRRVTEDRKVRVQGGNCSLFDNPMDSNS